MVFDLKYKVFKKLRTELAKLVDLDEVLSVDVDSSARLYIRVYKVSDRSGNNHSAKSNCIINL